MPRISTLLMFDGQAENAMDYYASVFEDGQVERIERYMAGDPGVAGSVKHATFRLGDQVLTCIDSVVKQPFTFTPAMSLLVHSSSTAELDRLFAGLADGGQVLMPLDAYAFSRRFGWLTDRFGVSWQLSLVDD
jgi:predicted 3-demethylubiquinone-9 3-methyltransferase (glyoxalase superfamily)